MSLAELVLEFIDFRNVVRMGNPQEWRQTIAERDDGPLPPLNLPLPIWDAYLTHPVSAFKVKLRNGTEHKLTGWSRFFYSWHTRVVVLALKDKWICIAADDVVAITGGHIAPSHVTTIERLRWFHQANPFSSIVVRTAAGEAFLLEQPNRFVMDEARSLLAIGLPTGTYLIPVAEITSVHALSDYDLILERLVSARYSVPFRPFPIRFADNTHWTVVRPEHLIVGKTSLSCANDSWGWCQLHSPTRRGMDR